MTGWKIPDQRFGPVADAGTVRLQPSDGGYNMLARGGAQVAHTALDWGASEIRAARQTELTRASAEATKQANELQLELERDGAWETVPTRWQTRAGEIKTKIGGTIADGVARDRFNSDFDKYVETHGITLKRKALQTGESQATAALEEELEQQARTAANAPSEQARELALDRAKAALNRWRGISDDGQGNIVRGTGWGDDLAASRRLRGFQTRIDSDKALGLIQSDPEAAAKLLADPAQFPHLNEEQRLRLATRAEARVHTVMAERRGLTSRRLEDEVASIRETGAGIGVTPVEIRRAYPPEDAQRIEQQLQVEREFYIARASIAFNTPEQDRELVASLTPKGEGYKDTSQRRDLVLQAMAQKQQMLFGPPGKPDQADPVGFVMQASPELRAHLQAASQDPKMLPQALAALDQAQAQLGVAEGDRRVMTTAQASDQARRIAAMPGEEAANAMQQLQTQYGGWWPQAWGDLVRSGKMPGEYRILALVDEPVARKSLAEALKIPMPELKKAAGSEAEPIDQGVDDALAQFRRSLAFVPDREATYNDMRDSVTRLAYRYTGTVNGTEALRRAADHIVNQRYDFSGYARVPKGKLAAAEDTGARVLNGLEPKDIMPELGDDDGSKSVAAAKRGFWVANRRDDGWIRLYVNGQPVLRSDNTPLEVLFRDIARSSIGEDMMQGSFFP